MSGEDQLIERIVRAIPSTRGASGRVSLRLGIGDDAAVITAGRGVEWVLSCDAFLEGVHFLADRHPATSVGFKALARATSDLAAMGARPRLFLLTLALPPSRTGKWLDGFLRGMGRAARQLGMRIAGGDTTKSATVSISITVLGEIAPGLAVTRAGARAGDVIYVSGRLGRAQLGLEMVRNAAATGKRGSKSQIRSLQAHLYPRIRVDLGAWLAKQRLASAMIDISDGLSTDLGRLCSASKVGARIWAQRIPRVEIPASKSDRFKAKRRAKKLDALQMALHGGDDYELLFTVPPRHSKRLQGAPGFREITAIGAIERGRQITLIDAEGKLHRLAAAGWDPFRG
jgi:thiamine-monophosphate kinase